MLKAITRDEQPKPHVPHENHIKANMHNHQMGTIDFPDNRRVSTMKYFHSEKKRDPNLN